MEDGYLVAEGAKPMRAAAVTTGQWLIVASLAVAAALLGANLLAPPRPAEAQTGSASGSGGGSAGAAGEIFAVAGQISRDTYGLYLLDNRNGTICLYEYVPTTRKLRLVAARTFIYDRQLDSYNTEPTPRDVAKLVAEARRLKEVTPEK